jgi:tetratricopeptide (TPR) repeat protein
MSEDMARTYIEDFHNQYGDAHYYFAQHAAFPLALTADLLYRLRAVFQRATDGQKIDIPWIAISDILLSPLCEEVNIGYELYEMDVSIRAHLLKDLQANPLFGTPRIEELALFLRNYVEKRLSGTDSVTHDLVQSQTWTALAYLKPNQVAQELAEQIKDLYIAGSIEQVRITSILETLKALDTPLAALKGFQPLLTYSQIQAHSLLGHRPVADAFDVIRQATQEVAESLNINLPLDREEVQKERSNRIQRTTSPQSDFYISHHVADHDWAEWIAKQLQDAGYSVNWDFEFGPTSSFDIDTTSLHTKANYTIALLSPDYLSMDNVENEWIAILNQSSESAKTLLLPIRIRECTPQDIFASIQYLDLVGHPQDTARELLLKFTSLDLHGFGELLRSFRIRAEMTQEELANALGVSRVTVRRWENGIYIPKYSKIEKIAQVLHLNAADQEILVDAALRMPARSALSSDRDSLTIQDTNAATEDDNAKTIQDLEKRASVDKDARAYAELGSSYERLRRVEDAIRAFENAQKLQPENTDVLFALSRLYNDTESYEQAIEILDRLIELRPEFADAYKQRGLVYRRRADAEFAVTEDVERRAEEYKRAIVDFERAVELRPDFEDALGSLGGLYRRLGDVERAAEYYQRLYAVNPHSSYGLGNLGSLSWYFENVKDARKYFAELEEVAQARIQEEREDGYWDYYDLALAQLATGKLAAARETYAKAIEETPAVAQLDAVLSNLYFLQRARAHIEGLEEIIAMIENAKDVKGEGES